MKRELLYIVILTLPAVSCSKFQRILNSANYEEKYDAAIRYYEKEDYYKAGLLFEELIPVYKVTEKSEKIQFYYAYCHFHEEQYTLSSYHFKTFYETFRRSEYAEESYFMYAFSLFKGSPRYYLDQSNTYLALSALQSFLNRYPDSEHVDESNKLIEELREKLEKKDFENAKLYYRLRNYKSAVSALENFRNDFPSSELNEEAAYLKVDAQYELAEISITDKQQERYLETIDYYHRFIDNYPKSIYLKAAENIYEACNKRLKTIKNEQK